MLYPKVKYRSSNSIVSHFMSFDLQCNCPIFLVIASFCSASASLSSIYTSDFPPRPSTSPSSPSVFKPPLAVFALSIATPCFPPLCRSSVTQCVHASVALQANTVAFWWPLQRHAEHTRPQTSSHELLTQGPNCSLLFVFKVSILNKHVSCK